MGIKSEGGYVRKSKTNLQQSFLHKTITINLRIFGGAHF